jgi:Fe-S-cluster containining protein
MIDELLSRQICAECKGCCVFDKNDIWEVQDKVPVTQKDGLFVCAHLTEKGCALGSDKPLECSLYPFRVMKTGNSQVIAVCKFCKAVTDLPLSKILQFTEEKHSEFYALARKFPEIVKEYKNEYIIVG